MPFRCTAHFENSDMADLAHRRLRRAGLNFSYTQEGVRQQSVPRFEPWYATNSVFPYATRPDRLGGATVKMRFDTFDEEKARAILRQTGGTIYP